ncbi:hypothetical protein GOODEAATRI_031541 [Goodea atripinnis]|uniref:Death domain-containing protein n=1 Tax=Goodea atripinnis TaxID=208336 RepID=A0ABV0PTQ2_9TELE
MEHNVLTACLLSADGAAYLKEIIPAFFIHHKIKQKRLRRIVLKLPSQDVREQRGTFELSFSQLHSRISSWVSSATPMQIRQLPVVLIKMRASHAGEKLQNKLNRIDKNLSKQCNLGSVSKVDLNSALA